MDEELYAVCEDCQQAMTPGNGCSVQYLFTVDKGYYERIKAGSMFDIKPEMGVTDLCPDCNVKADQYHHLGCDMERCPICRGQFISCGCFCLECHKKRPK